MISLKTTALVLATAIPALTFTAPSQATMSPYMESALVNVCKAAKSNKMHKFQSTRKAHNLKSRTIALKVSCNGQDIIAFAQSHGAHKTAGHLSDKIGNVSISEIAAVKKVNVNFEG